MVNIYYILLFAGIQIYIPSAFKFFNMVFFYLLKIFRVVKQIVINYHIIVLRGVLTINV